MWVPKSVAEWLHVSRDTVSSLREDLAAIKAERDELQKQALINRVNFDWLRMQVNTLQLEKTALLEKAYNIKLPAPEIVRTPVIGSDAMMEDFNFDDIGDTLAKKYGFPVHDAS
jgi:hypothetical protein